MWPKTAILEPVMRLSVALALISLVVSCAPATRGQETGPGQIGTWGGGGRVISGLSGDRSSGLVGQGEGALGTLFANLRALELGQVETPIVVVQLGDSHTAGDYFSGQLRRRFQERFGAAGRGMMGAGVPFPYFQPTLVEVSQTDGWEVESSFTSNPTGIYTLTGYRVVGEDSDDVISLVSTEPEGFDYLALGVVRQPGGGTVRVTVDGQDVYRLDTDGTAVQAARLDLPLPSGSRRLRLSPAGDGPVTLASWITQRTRPGVVLDSHGVVGASINIIGNWHPGDGGLAVGVPQSGLGHSRLRDQRRLSRRFGGC